MIVFSFRVIVGVNLIWSRLVLICEKTLTHIIVESASWSSVPMITHNAIVSSQVGIIPCIRRSVGVHIALAHVFSLPEVSNDSINMLRSWLS